MLAMLDRTVPQAQVQGSPLKERGRTRVVIGERGGVHEAPFSFLRSVMHGRNTGLMCGGVVLIFAGRENETEAGRGYFTGYPVCVWPSLQVIFSDFLRGSFFI
eukprot:Hpha_TRINITY_DN16834_c4_g9::TRINITY_DN16834_c4_g9_i1::g.152311::m.152311